MNHYNDINSLHSYIRVGELQSIPLQERKVIHSKMEFNFLACIQVFNLLIQGSWSMDAERILLVV